MTAVRSIHGISLVFVPVLILSLFRPAHARELCRDPSALDRAKTVTLHVIDVGQGDAMALVCQDGSIGMVIDGGDYRDRGGLARFRKKVKALADASPAGRSVKLVMATHQDSDHISGLEWLLDSFSVDAFMDNGRPANSRRYMNLHARVLELRSSGKMKYLPAAEAGAITVCPGVKVSIVAPPRLFGACRPQNGCSIVTKVRYGKVSFLLTGDADRVEEGELLRGAGAMLGSDVIKIGHHGLGSSSGLAFLKAVAPGCAVISTGKPGERANSQYRNPSEIVVKRILKLVGMDRPGGGKITAWNRESQSWVTESFSGCLFSTSSDGTVSFSTDGVSLGCTASGGR